MNWSPNSIIYACIAKHTTILTEFSQLNSTELTNLAQQCLHKTPLFHTVFSHTVHGRTYMFFITNPFVYFGIFGESLDKQNCLLFLKTVHDVFNGMVDGLSSDMMKMSSHCLQGEFGPVFRRLVESDSGVSLKDGLEGDGLSDDDVSCRCGFVLNKHVMVVLCMDLVVCVGLFFIWLLVCEGLRCVAN